MRNAPDGNGKRQRPRRNLAWVVLLLGVALSIYVMLGGHTSRSHLTGSLAKTRALSADPNQPAHTEPAASEPSWFDRFSPQSLFAASRPPPAEQVVGGTGGSSKGLGEVSSEVASELNEEQRAVLREHRVDEVGQLVAAAHNRSGIAHEDERVETQHNYQMLLDLWMKVHRQDGPQRSAELLRREEQFYRELPAEQIRLFHLPISVDERREKLAEFKSEFFAKFGD
jgi:hypothetical protein